jgi:ubiquinone/menaquinone biosynthesis C-methylase UbiE
VIEASDQPASTSDSTVGAGERRGPQPDHRPDPKTANILYHDAAARAYDSKWAISFDDRCTSYVRDRAERMLPRRRYGSVLDVGCGTGFFLLNLWRAGFVGEAHACDLSPGMIAVCAESARAMGCDARLQTGDIESLPYAGETFDLVVGHAVLHHVPDPHLALREINRVLRPGGYFLIAGEPTRWGDRMAKGTGRATARALRGAARVAPRIRKPSPIGSPTADERTLRDLEWHVDLHTFAPAELSALAVRAGFEGVRVETEELLSSLVGWAVRTAEAELNPDLFGRRWAEAAYRVYRGLYRFDRAVLYPLLPRSIFYNVLISGRKPG